MSFFSGIFILIWQIPKTELFVEVLAKIMAHYPKLDPVGQEIYPRIQGGIQTLFSLEKIPVQHIVIIFQNVISIKPDFVLEFQTSFVQLIEVCLESFHSHLIHRNSSTSTATR